MLILYKFNFKQPIIGFLLVLRWDLSETLNQKFGPASPPARIILFLRFPRYLRELSRI